MLRQWDGAQSAVVHFVLEFTEGIVFEWKQLQLYDDDDDS